jgi:cysteine desulfuration protein SufE
MKPSSISAGASRRCRRACETTATCRGDAWLAGIRRDGRLYLSAASETGVLAGLLAIIVEVYSGRAAEDVLHHPLVVLETTGLSQRLSPHRLAACREILVRLRELAS